MVQRRTWTAWALAAGWALPGAGWAGAGAAPGDGDVDRAEQVGAAAPFEKGGQRAWFHDEGNPSGFFHTYDAFRVGGPGDAGRKVHVYVPRDYETSGRRYPTVYMNDGDTAFFPGGLAGKTWGVAAALDGLYAAGAIGPVIVVAVAPIARDREYTHESWLFGRDCCGLDGYVGYLADGVKGWVDANYRTRPGPESTAVVGSSHGGLAAFYTAAARPDRFGLAGCLSSSFWAGLDPGFLFGGEALRDSRLIARAGPTLADAAGRPRLWLDWGLVRSGGEHNSLVEAMATTRGREMAALLRDGYGYGPGELATREDAQGGHDEDSWGRRFPDVMRFLFAAP